MNADHRVLAGRYRLLERLGSGGMGSVWRARDEFLGRDVAIKEVVAPPELPESERSVAYERAQREARAAALPEHPAIIKVHDVVVEDGRPWIVMELVAGPSLDRVIAERGPLPFPMVARIGAEVLAALRAAHSRGVLHRDVKPSNVLLADDGRVILTDFGIATVEGDPSLTRTGTFVGSPGYVAPERLREEPDGPESDLWSLAATLYTAVEGRPAFERDTPMAAFGAALTEEAPPPSRAGSLAPLLWHLLRRDPARRLPAGHAEEVLRRVAAGGPSGLTVPPPPPPVRRTSRRSLVIAAVAAVLVMTGTVSALVLWPGDSPSGSTTRSTSPVTPPRSVISAPPASASPSPVDYCRLLSTKQAASLVPSAHSRMDTDPPPSCNWTTKKHRGLTVGEGAFEATDSPTSAHNSFVNVRNARVGSRGHQTVWGWDEIGVRHAFARVGAVRTVRGLGDEAFAYEEVGTTTTVDQAHVVFRVKSAVVEIEFYYDRGTATPADAQRAAGWAATALARRG